jgi:CubicO group peptidase (beta-lactamase class C family)
MLARPPLSAVALLLALLVAPPAAPAAAAEANDSLDARLEELTRESSAPGVAIAVLAGGEVVLRRALGWADVEKKRPMTAPPPPSTSARCRSW